MRNGGAEWVAGLGVLARSDMSYDYDAGMFGATIGMFGHLTYLGMRKFNRQRSQYQALAWSGWLTSYLSVQAGSRIAVLFSCSEHCSNIVSMIVSKVLHLKNATLLKTNGMSEECRENIDLRRHDSNFISKTR